MSTGKLSGSEHQKRPNALAAPGDGIGHRVNESGLCRVVRNQTRFRIGFDGIATRRCPSLECGSIKHVIF